MKKQLRLRPMCEHVLRALRFLGGSAQPKEVIEWLAKQFALSNSALSRRTRSGAKRFDNAIRWAREDLAGLGLLDRSDRGRWTLTPLGSFIAGLV